MKRHHIRPIEFGDNLAVAAVIRTVMPEFGAGGAGFAIHDSEVDNMHTAYTQARSIYFICEEEGVVLGGGGIAPLQGGQPDTCELKKMYLTAGARHKGIGQQILNLCLKHARELNYRYCYLETFNTMNEAMKLYERNGFMKIPQPLGATGHFGCDTFYQLDLQAPLLANGHN